MGANPLLGVMFHWIGGFASASFYVPYKGVRKWSWEIFWLVGGLFSWIVAPWLFASLRTHSLLGVLAQARRIPLFWCCLSGCARRLVSRRSSARWDRRSSTEPF